MKDLKVFALLLRLRPSWGYSVKVPNTSASQPSLSLPPPTTLVGAVAYGVLKLQGRDQETEISGGRLTNFAEKLWSATVYSGASLNGFGAPIMDISKYIIRIYQRKANRDRPEYQLGAIPTGKVYVTGEIRALLGFHEERLSKIVEKFDEVLPKASYLVTRLGAKESIVSVEEVKWGYSKVLGREVEFCSSFYQPLQHSVPLGGCDGQGFFYKETFWDGGFFDVGKERGYLVPGVRDKYISSLRGKFKADKSCEVHEFEGEGFVVCDVR